MLATCKVSPDLGETLLDFSTFEPDIGGKWLELLKEVVPGLRRVAAVWDPGFKGFAGVWEAIERLAPRFGLELTSISFHAPTDDLESAVAAFAREQGGGLIVVPTALNAVHRYRIFSAAAVNRLPAIYAFRFYAMDGGLMAYGIDNIDLFRRGAAYVDRVLRGETRSRPPGAGTDEVRAGDQSQDGKVSQHHCAADLQQLADEVIE